MAGFFEELIPVTNEFEAAGTTPCQIETNFVFAEHEGLDHPSAGWIRLE
jgi:hypothetical protein